MKCRKNLRANLEIRAVGPNSILKLTISLTINTTLYIFYVHPSSEDSTMSYMLTPNLERIVDDRAPKVLSNVPWLMSS